MAIKTSLPSQNTARKLGMVASTFAVAMGVGFFMQQGEATASQPQAPDLVDPQASVAPQGPTQGSDVAAQVVADAGQAPGAPLAAPLAAPAPEEAVDVAAATGMDAGYDMDGTAMDAPAADAAFAAMMSSATDVAPDFAAAAQVAAPLVQAPGADLVPASLPTDTQSCDPFMTGLAQEAAMVRVLLTAPCQLNATFTIHHEGMMFTAKTDENGTASIDAPALVETAVYIAAFEDGLGAVAEVTVPDVDSFDRVVLQWEGQNGFEIHAMEYGAGYGEAGHVWREAARDLTTAAEGQGGFIVTLGDSNAERPLLAEVYTFPSANAPKAGEVALSVETEVTAANCNTDIVAQTLQRQADDRVKIADLTLSVPDCDAIGEYLVLKNLLGDLTLAQG